MKTKSVQKKKLGKRPLVDLVRIPPKTYPSTNIEHDNIMILQNYLPSASTIEIIERFSAGLHGTKSGRMLSITGPYGSGKSTMAVFLDALVSESSGKEWKDAYKILKRESVSVAETLVHARKKSGVHKEGLIRCSVTAGREPISVTILRALGKGTQRYFGTKQEFSTAKKLGKMTRGLKQNKIPLLSDIVDVIVDVCKHAPTMIMIDEFGKNIEYFTADETQQSDLFLLQQLAEMAGAGRKLPLFIITFQHMAFEEYAIGTTLSQKQEWAKIQGRFEDIPFANSLDQTRLLVSNTIELDKNPHKRIIVKNWAENQACLMKDLGIDGVFDAKLIAACYPLSPIVLEVLPELCSRYGQYERTLLSFLSGAGKYTVATFIDESTWSEDNILPTMELDMLYDYFISGTSMIHSSSANITRLREIETIIRDAHGLDAVETKALKIIGMLNLIGRSGYLRASQKMLDCAMNCHSQPILKRLAEKSIITYRKHTDEYRIWHGTDIDIALKLDIHRKRYQNTPLLEILKDNLIIEPIVALNYSIETGTLRIFERRFTTDKELRLSENYDGAILYTSDGRLSPTCDKPVIMVNASNTSSLRRAAIEVAALRDVLESNRDVASDWVARREMEERLAEAEVALDMEFDATYGNKAKWSYLDKTLTQDTHTMCVSYVCEKAYSKTPRIHNEMLNRNVLSSQGAAAKRNLLDAMITHTNEPQFGIKGYGPDRAIYEAVFYRNKIHVPDSKMGWKLQDPKEDAVMPAWNAMLDVIRKSKGRTNLLEIYRVCRGVPYGMKDGTASTFLAAILLVHAKTIALYEHGTYVPYLAPEIIERMLKNPIHFETKYFKNTPSRRKLLKTLASDFKINSDGSVLDVVSHLVTTISALQPYVKQTKLLDKHSIAVRDTILKAVEPDTLLFEELPHALGLKLINTKISDKEIHKFSRILVKSINTLQNKFSSTISELKDLLLVTTEMDDRKKLSNTASIVLKSVSDQKMKVFLTALTADALERDEDWINYVALSITNKLMLDWSDDQKLLFENSLTDIANSFKRLAGIHFSTILSNLRKPSYQVIVTKTDGTEHRNIVSLKPEREKELENFTSKVLLDMKKNGFTQKDLSVFMALFISKIK